MYLRGFDAALRIVYDCLGNVDGLLTCVASAVNGHGAESNGPSTRANPQPMGQHRGIIFSFELKTIMRVVRKMIFLVAVAFLRAPPKSGCGKG